MIKYVFKNELEKSILNIFHDYFTSAITNGVPEYVRHLRTIQYNEPEEITINLEKEYKYKDPIFLSKEEQVIAIRQYETYEVIKGVCNYYLNLNESDNEELLLEFEAHYYGNVYSEKEIFSFKCFPYTIMAFEDKIFEIDYKKYGFNDTLEMFYSLEAYIFNILNESPDKREVYKVIGDVVYNYANHIHGDFRLEKYDISQKEMINPFSSGKLRFNKVKLVGALNGYHSIEHSILSLYLYLANKRKVKVEIIESFDEYLNEINKENQVFGNYADAGCLDSFAIFHALSFFKYDSPPIIHCEHHESYESKLIDEGLACYKVDSSGNKSVKASMIIKENEINDLIDGLFQKVRNGNGRSSVEILKNTIQLYKEETSNKSVK